MIDLDVVSVVKYQEVMGWQVHWTVTDLDVVSVVKYQGVMGLQVY